MIQFHIYIYIYSNGGDPLLAMGRVDDLNRSKAEEDNKSPLWHDNIARGLQNFPAYGVAAMAWGPGQQSKPPVKQNGGGWASSSCTRLQYLLISSLPLPPWQDSTPNRGLEVQQEDDTIECSLLSWKQGIKYNSTYIGTALGHKVVVRGRTSVLEHERFYSRAQKTV